MKKFYKLEDNQFIINPGTELEENITKQAKECLYCQYDVLTCKGNKEGIYCDWFTIINEYEELSY